MSAPFRVHKVRGGWVLHPRGWNFSLVGFATAGEAIDYAYKQWPWWP